MIDRSPYLDPVVGADSESTQAERASAFAAGTGRLYESTGVARKGINWN
jgi:hypothetical protein